MTQTSETVVFFGSGPVAAKSLELLHKNFSIEAVITKPKPAHHRGSFPVIDIAEELELPLYTVSNKAELSKLVSQGSLRSRVGIVIDFGIIISQDVIDYFALGIINSHFSLLPEWRGADPISFAILSGQPKTGVSLMVIDAGLDTGKLITTRGIPIELADTTPSLTDKLIHLSNDLLNDYIPDYIKGLVKPRTQPHHDRATYSRKLTKDDGIIDWSKPAEQIEREIRAYIEWPKSRTTLAGKDVIITSGLVVDKTGPAGSVFVEDKKLIICCGKNSLMIEELKPAGKGVMSGEAFLAGHAKNL